MLIASSSWHVLVRKDDPSYQSGIFNPPVPLTSSMRILSCSGSGRIPRSLQMSCSRALRNTALTCPSSEECDFVSMFSVRQSNLVASLEFLLGTFTRSDRYLTLAGFTLKPSASMMEKYLQKLLVYMRFRERLRIFAGYD